MARWNLHTLQRLFVCALAVAVAPASVAHAIQEDSDAQWLSLILRDSGAAASVRAGAANRMALSYDPVVIQALADAVHAAGPTQLQIIATGVHDAERVPLAVVTAVIANACEHGGLRPEHHSIFRTSGEDAVEVLQDAAAVGEEACRVLAIEALGTLKSASAAEALIQLLSVLDATSSAVEHIDRALAVFANDDVSRTPDAWRTWWRDHDGPNVAVLSAEELEVHRLAESKRANVAEARATALAERLADSFVRLLTAMPEDEREAKIIELSHDEEPAIRRVAVTHVERMLRNGRTPSEELKQAVVERLTDRDGAIRLTTARLLDAMGQEDLGERLVAAISRETQPDVLVGMFEILGHRPIAAVLPEAIKNMKMPAGDRSDAAAGAIIALGRAGMLTAEATSRVRASLGERSEGITTAALATVAVLVGEGSESAATLLKSPLDAVRLGAATGLRIRGDRAQLLEAATDPLLVSVAIAACTDVPQTLASIEALLRLEPLTQADATVGEAWTEALGVVLGGLAPDALLGADEQLARRPELFDLVRTALHRSATRDDVDLVTREAAARRLSARLIEREEPLEAAAELRAAGASATSALGSELFEALLLGKSWDEAAFIRAEPSAWVGVLKTQRTARPAFATLLAAEIAARFDVELTRATDDSPE